MDLEAKERKIPTAVKRFFEYNELSLRVISNDPDILECKLKIYKMINSCNHDYKKLINTYSYELINKTLFEMLQDMHEWLKKDLTKSEAKIISWMIESIGDILNDIIFNYEDEHKKEFIIYSRETVNKILIEMLQIMFEWVKKDLDRSDSDTVSRLICDTGKLFHDLSDNLTNSK